MVINMKKGQEAIGIVEYVEFPNRGRVIVDDEGEQAVVTVKNVVEGQKLSIRISKKRKGKYEGRMLEVLEKSSYETREDTCPYFGDCGGCIYDTVPYKGQLKIKEAQIKRLLAPVLGEELYDNIYQGITGSVEELEYRNKMEYTFGDSEKGGILNLGHHRRGAFYDILPTTGCRLVDKDMRKVHEVTLEYFRQHKTSYYHRRTHEGYLRHLLVRKGKTTGEILVSLVTSGTFESKDDVTEQQLLEGWKEKLLACDYDGVIKGVLHTKNDRIADVVEDQGTEILYGEDCFYEKLLGLKFKVSPFSFFQTNSKTAELLYSTAREWIMEAMSGRDDLGVVYDLYSGTGTIAQMLSPAAKKVVGVEIVEEAVVAARENAAENKIDNCEFIAGDVLKVLDGVDDKPDMIVLDPPRDGVNPKALGKILTYGVENILYISCKATSLARDIPMFLGSGYEPKKIAIIDMFPNTANTETVVLLTRVN